METNTLPPAVAVIREAECIGCTKCIQVCPVDAIIGAAKQMHTVITDICTGCKLCIEPCPVDCIDLVAVPLLSSEQQQEKAILSKQRSELRIQRLEQRKAEKENKQNTAKILQRKKEIAEAVARVKEKKKIPLFSNNRYKIDFDIVY